MKKYAYKTGFRKNEQENGGFSLPLSLLGKLAGNAKREKADSSPQRKDAGGYDEQKARVLSALNGNSAEVTENTQNRSNEIAKNGKNEDFRKISNEKNCKNRDFLQKRDSEKTIIDEKTQNREDAAAKTVQNDNKKDGDYYSPPPYYAL